MASIKSPKCCLQNSIEWIANRIKSLLDKLINKDKTSLTKEDLLETI